MAGPYVADVDILLGGGQLLSNIRGRGNIGTRSVPIGLMSEFTTDGQFTWQARVAVAAQFDAIRVIFANGLNAGATTGSPTFNANVSTVSDTTTAPAANGATLNLTFAGSTTGTLTAAAAATTPSQTKRKKYTFSDWLPVSSIARTDGGPGALLNIRCCLTNVAATPVLIPGATSAPYSGWTGWATKSDGRVWASTFKGGNALAQSYSTFAGGASVAAQTPIAGIQYMARGRVVTIMGVGDSIKEGFGATLYGDSFGYRAALANSTASQPIEYCNFGWASSNYNEILSIMVDASAAGINPDVVILPGWTPNGATGAFTASTIQAESQMLSQCLGYATQNGIAPIVWTGLPSTAGASSGKTWGATADGLRIAYNTSVRGYSASGVPVVDLGTLFAGPVDGSGQQTLLYSDDGLHPNEAGNVAATPTMTQAIRAVVPSVAIAPVF